MIAWRDAAGGTELDAEGEWYFDDKAGTLYLKPAAGVNIADAEVIAAGLKELIVLEGTVRKPVRNVSFKGITFKHTSRTILATKQIVA